MSSIFTLTLRKKLCDVRIRCYYKYWLFSYRGGKCCLGAFSHQTQNSIFFSFQTTDKRCFCQALATTQPKCKLANFIVHYVRKGTDTLHHRKAYSSLGVKWSLLLQFYVRVTARLKEAMCKTWAYYWQGYEISKNLTKLSLFHNYLGRKQKWK